MPCVAYIADMRVKIEPNSYTYPDVVTLCGEPQFEDAEVDTLLNPQVIIEVLSPSMEARNRGLNLGQYLNLPSVTDYVLIAQDRVSIEHYHRSSSEWLREIRNELHSTLHFEAIRCSIITESIYDKV